MNKKIILIIFVIFILVFGIYQIFFKEKKAEFNFTEVKRGNISQEVSETGQIGVGDEINLGSKNAGRIEKIYVKVGDGVEAGQDLAKLETTQLSIQLSEARAALEVVQAKLNKLLAGASSEEIKVAQTSVKNSQISLDSANQTLKDANDDAFNTLDDCYLKAYNAQVVADAVQRSYFMVADQEGVIVRENKEKINKAVSQIKSSLGVDALSQIKTELVNIFDALKIIRENCETAAYQSKVSSTDKTSLDTHRGYINTALTNLTNAQQTITSAKLSIDSALGDLQSAKDNLALVTAPPRQEDVDLYQGQVAQAKAQVDILENQIQEAFLRSPVNGKVAEIKKRAGELVQSISQDVVMVILPGNPFQIEVDIYEEDIVKVKVGNYVDIKLTAFPDKIFNGKVIEIDPAEKLVEGVVYYEVTIDFQNPPEDLKPGMSADVVIKTAQKENVLIISEAAIQKKDGKTIVKVLKNGTLKELEEREIELGLHGNDGLVEVISGLKEGEKVVLK